jgi:hypothetical protein
MTQAARVYTVFMTALADTDLTECQTSKNLEAGKRPLSPIAILKRTPALG